MWEHLAEIEWMERWRDYDRSADRADYYSEISATETCGLDDIPEYSGYWPHIDDFADFDWPCEEYFTRINWHEIPF